MRLASALLAILAAASALPSVSSDGSCACSCQESAAVVEQLLGVAKEASATHDALLQRFLRLQADSALRGAVASVPLEAWLALGLLAAWGCTRLGAARARRRSGADVRLLAGAVQQRMAMWKAAVAESSELAALLHTQRPEAAAARRGAAAGGAACDLGAAASLDASKAAARDTVPCKVRAGYRI